MPRKSKNSFAVNGDTIFIGRPEWETLAMCTYRDDYYSELSSHTWGLNNGYPSNSSLGGGLHRYMMAKWYGKDVLEDMTAKGYVVDHMNNNHMDCRICNLEFYKNNRNVAKGQYLDKEIPLQYGIALNIFKDFTTGCYQITIGCNDTIKTNTGSIVNSIKLLYDSKYPMVVLDAERILTEYTDEHTITLSNLGFCRMHLDYALDLDLTDKEKEQAFVIRNGELFFVIGNGKTYINAVNYDEGWTPPQKKS
ncbi:MAG: hypothetical protein IJK23_01890 [Clostridia bacterium]|nr:hypothetical protein [Clostridia bacterium]